MQTLEQWLHANHFRISRLYRGDMRFLLDAPCNEVLEADPPSRPFYVDAERKTQSFPCYKLGRVPVHGFGRWKWGRWQQAARPVWLVVAEAQSGELLALRIDGEMYDDEYDGAAKGVDRGGMVYLRKSRFTKLADLTRPDAAPRQPGFWDLPV